VGLWPASPSLLAPPLLSMSGTRESTFAMLLHAVPGTFTQVTLAAGTMVLFPYLLPEPYTAVKGWWMNGSSGLAGSVQIAVYSRDFALLAASATAVQAGLSVLQEVAISPAVQLPRGLIFLALATSAAGTLATYNSFGGNTTVATQLGKAAGMLLASPAYPAPATISPIVTTAGLALVAGISNRALVV
jgi:hypothetical protein